MSSQSTNSNIDRDVLREKERQARARALNRGGRNNGPGGGAGGGSGRVGGGMEEMRESAPKPFFPQPIKVDPALEDETSRKIRNTLGDFREVQRYLENDPKHLIGISSNPALVNSSSGGNNGSQGQHQRTTSTKDSSSHHDDHNKKGMVNGQYKSPSFGSVCGGGGNGSMHHRNNRSHHPSQPPKHSQQSQNSSSGPSSAVGSSNYQAQSGRKSGASNTGKEVELPPAASSKGHRKKIPYPLSSSSSHGNRVINSSSGTSSTVNPASSSGVPKDALTGGRPNKINNSSSSRPDSRRSNPSVYGGGPCPVKSGAGLGFNSSRGASNNSSYHNSHNGEIGSNMAQNNSDTGRLPRIPKLPLATMSIDNALPLDPASGSVVELETIFQEMKQGVPPPLSAIETPRVEDSRIFFSPDPNDPVHNTSQSSNTQNQLKTWTSRGRSSNGGRRQEKQPPTLRDDLAISESDDEGDLPQKRMSHRLSECRSPLASYGFQYGGAPDNHSSHNQSSQSRHVGGVPGTPPGTPPESPPSSPHESSPRSINGSPIHSLQGSVIHSPSGSLPGSPQPPMHGSPIHSPMDLDPPSPRSPSVVSNRGSSESSNNSSSISSEGESSDEEDSDKEDIEEDHKDSDDLNDDLKEMGIKDKEFEANMVNERGRNVDDGMVHSGDDSAAKNNWALRNFMEKKNSPALPALATPGRSGLGFRSDRLGSDNTVASCDGKGDRSDTHLGQGGRYDSLADPYSVSEILNQTPDIKEILRSPTPYIMELDNMRPNQTTSSSQGDLMSPINSPETPAPPTHRQNLRVQSSSSDSKRHSSTYYNPAARTSVSPCGKRNNGRDEDAPQPLVRARTANKTSKHKSRKDTRKSRQNISDLSDSDYDDKKSVSPKRSSSVSSTCSSVDGQSEAPPKPTLVTVTSSRKNDSLADSRKQRPITGKKGVKKMGKGANVNKADDKIFKTKRTSSTSASRSISPRENPSLKTAPKPKIVKRDKVKEKPTPVVKEAPRKTPKMPGRPPGSGKVASKTVSNTKKSSGDESDKNKKGKTPVFKSKEYIESSESDSSANSASEAESAASNAEEEDEAGEVGEVVFGKSPRKKPFAMVHPLPPLSPVKPQPVKEVIASITKPEITLPPKDFSVPLKGLTPGRPPGKSKSSKDRMPAPKLVEENDRSEALSTPNSNHIEYNEEILPPRLMVRISLSLLDRIPRYPPISCSIAKVPVVDCMDYNKVISDGGTASRLSSKGRDVSQDRFGFKASADSMVKRDSSRETVVRAKEAKAQPSVKKRNSSMEAASRPSKCRTPPPATKRKLKEEDKKDVPYAKRQKIKDKIETSQSERSNVVMDEEIRCDNVTPKMERSDSVSSLASFTSQQSHHGSLRSATPTVLKRSSKKDKKEKEVKKEVPVEQFPKSNISAPPRAGAITPSESKKVSGPLKKELTSNVASVVSEKEARKKEKEEKRKHRNRSKEKPDANASSSGGGLSGASGKPGESASQATQQSNKDSGELDSKSKVKRMKMSPKHELQDEGSSSQRGANLKGGKESSKGEKKSCDKGGLIDNSPSTAQCRLDYEPRDERPSSDYYLGEAKRLKHQADKEANRTLQVTKYLEAVLYFILTGNAMEDAQHDKDKVYTMYKETLHLIKSISSKFQKNQSSSTGSTDNKLAVLSLRCQSRLFLKLFAIRKPEVKDLQRKIMEFQKSQAGKLATQLSLTAGNAIPGQLLTSSHHLKSPCQPGRGLSGSGVNGVPSPHSPTPSPAGSVASVGSQSSGYSSSELNGNQGRHSLPNNGSSCHPHAPSSIAPPGNLSHQSTSGSSVSIPAIIYGMMQRQQSHYSNLQQCHDLWEQGDYLIASCHAKDFFESLDKACGKLTLHSTISELVHYIHQGLNRLKDSDT